MHPRIPGVLSELVGAADRLVKADRPRGYDEDRRAIDRLIADLEHLRKLPSEDGERLADDATMWLAQAIRNAEREGPLGAAQKWVRLAAVLVVWVRTDFALALERSLQVPTSEQGR